MKNGYKRRSDFGEMPRQFQMGILVTERDELAESDEEKARAAADVARLQEVIEQYDVKHAAPEYGMERNPTHELYQGGPTKRF